MKSLISALKRRSADLDNSRKSTLHGISDLAICTQLHLGNIDELAEIAPVLRRLRPRSTISEEFVAIRASATKASEHCCA